MLIEYLVSAVILGFVVAIPPGSVTVVAGLRAIQCGFKNSLVFTCGSSLADIFYLLLVYYGFANIISGNQTFKIVFGIICAGILIIFGVTSLLSARNTQSNKLGNFQINPLATFISGILVTLTNPMTIAGWIGIAGNFFSLWNKDFPPSKNMGVVTIVLIMAGVLIWFVPLLFIISRFKKIINEKLKMYLIMISGIFLIAFGITGLYYIIRTIISAQSA